MRDIGSEYCWSFSHICLAYCSNACLIAVSELPGIQRMAIVFWALYANDLAMVDFLSHKVSAMRELQIIKLCLPYAWKAMQDDTNVPTAAEGLSQERLYIFTDQKPFLQED
jgi:hypothetical protein